MDVLTVGLFDNYTIVQGSVRIALWAIGFFSLLIKDIIASFHMPEQFRSYVVEGLPDTPSNIEWLRAHFHCRQCGECCTSHTVGVRITGPEAERLAEREGLTLAAFTSQVLDDRDTFIIPQPCRYFSGNMCTVHDIKPSVCRKYPFNRREVVDRRTAWVVIAGCPGGIDLVRLLASGPQLGLEYIPYGKK
jgi:Fe-S-cluster containining protein